MNRTPIAISLRLIAVASVAMLLVVAACSSSDDDDADATTTPTATSTADASTPTPAGTTAATSTPGGSTSDDPGGMNEQVPANGDDDLVELGKDLYFGDAGSFGGCAVCHGQNAEGLIGPPIVGKRFEDIELQLDTNEAMMGLGLSDDQIEAVAAYLQSLAP